MSEEHKPCPFCHGTLLHSGTTFGRPKEYATSVIVCDTCGARGPTGDPVCGGGWDKWNAREPAAAAPLEMAMAVIDLDNPDANMFGCLPCPKCGSERRSPYARTGVLRIECECCGFTEPAFKGKEDEC